MTVQLERPFRRAVEGVRASLEGRERTLFDLLCGAGQLCYRLPHDDINLRHVWGDRSPKRRLSRDFASIRRALTDRPEARQWTLAGDRLARRLIDVLASRGSWEYRPLRVLLAYAPGALAPDGKAPEDPLLRLAWRTVVRLFGRIFPSRVRRLGRLGFVDTARLAALRRETAAGQRKGRRASGQRAGPEGRLLAVDPRLMRLAGKALQKRMRPGYQARYLFYTRTGDHFWPHPDDPAYAAQLLLCIEHKVPARASNRSAFLAYRPDGTVKRYEIAPGSALVVAPGTVHGREPMRKGESLVMLSIGVKPAPGVRRTSSPPRR